MLLKYIEESVSRFIQLFDKKMRQLIYQKKKKKMEIWSFARLNSWRELFQNFMVIYQDRKKM